jgi:hypothetical protein
MHCKNDVLNHERKYIGELYHHADQLLDNLDDIKDIFDLYLAIKLYNWRCNWFYDHYEAEEWTNDDGLKWSVDNIDEITFNSIPFNVCMNWHMVLDKYYQDDRPIDLPSDKYYSDICREKLDNGSLPAYYFRNNIQFPIEFMNMFYDLINFSHYEGERALKDNLTPSQLEDYHREQQDYYYANM